MKKRILFLSAMLASLSMSAQVASVASPDGRLKVNVDVKGGKPVYEVKYDDKQVLDESPLGFVADNGDFTQGITFDSKKEEHLAFDYEMTRSKFSKVHVDANQLVVTLKNAQGYAYDVDFRVSNNDVAFRYAIPNHPSRRNEKKFSIRIMKEATGFDFPSQTTTFLTPQSDAMIGWKGTKPSYEEGYGYDEPMNKRSGYGHGYTFPCLFHIGDAWALVSETGVDSRYCASRLSDMKGDGLYTVEFPMPEENGGNGTVEPAFALPGATPWRTITVGTSLKPIVETTVPWDYVEPRYDTPHHYEFGKGTWSWIVWQDNSINYDDQVKYIQLSKAMGFKYVLIDNWWDTNIGKEADGTAKNPAKSIEKLIEYAHSKNVDVFLWYSSSGYWNDIEQGPINRMANSVIRKREMKWLESVGVKGIKVDFFGGDKQETIRLYEEILSDADDHGLMVIFHGCTLPRGWERMYPNYVGSEAVLASENIVFDQAQCDLEAKYATLHPVLRNTVGCMEFGGSFQNKYMNRDNKPRENRHINTRPCTSTFSLATAILYQNPIQNFALAPNNLEDAPEVSMQFMRDVPTTWDEVRYIDGYPGRYLIMARRHGDTWYVAAINAEQQKLVISLDLSVLDATSFTLYSGGDNPTAKPMKLKGGKTLLNLAPNDGIVIVAK